MATNRSDRRIEPGETVADTVTPDGPAVFGAIGDELFIADGNQLARWSEVAGVERVPTISPAQYMKFNGGYMKDPDPALVDKALEAYETDVPQVSDNFSDPAVLNMSGPRDRTKDAPKPDTPADTKPKRRMI